MPGKIAIVEDDYLLALVLTKHLTKEGYECHSFPKASDFFHFFEQNKDLHSVILDVKLKGAETGLDIFHELSKTSNVPVVFATGNSDIPELKILNTPQIKGILIKPIYLEELSRILCELPEA